MALTIIASLGALIALVWASGLMRRDTRGDILEYPMLVASDIPAAIALGPRDEVWFSIDFSDSIGLLKDGKITRFRIGQRIVEPIGLGVDSRGNAWIADQVTRSIARVSPAGEVQPFALNTPIARLARLAVAPDDSVWFAESTAYSVTRLKDGKLERHVIESDRGGPYGVAVERGGSVWASLQHANQLLQIGADGRLLTHTLPTPASAPSDVAVDASGAVWVLQFRSNKLARFAGGKFTEFDVPVAGAALAGIAAAPDGSIWFAMLRAHALGRWRNGVFKSFPLPRADARPCGVAVDSAGNVWYADMSGFVGRLSAERARAN